MDDGFPLGSAFRIDWLEEALTRNEREEIERAVALAAASILRSARFARTLGEKAGTDLEVRVWLDVDLFPAQAVVWWEARLARFWFAIVDSADSARLGLVVFERVPSVGRAQMERDESSFVLALRDALPDGAKVPWSDVRARLGAGMTTTGVDP